MAERVTRERIQREDGWLYFLGKDGYAWRTPMTDNPNGKTEKIGTEKVKRDENYLYFIDKDGYVARTKMNTKIRVIPQPARSTLDSPATHYEQGLGYHNAGRYLDAIKEYDIAIRLNPNYANAYSNKAGALESLGRHAEAIKAYDMALRLNPKDAISYNGKGNALDGLGKSEEAIEQYNVAIRLNPSYANAHYNKGLTLAKSGRYTDAIKEYDVAISSNPINRSIYQESKNKALAKMAENESPVNTGSFFGRLKKSISMSNDKAPVEKSKQQIITNDREKPFIAKCSKCGNSIGYSENKYYNYKGKEKGALDIADERIYCGKCYDKYIYKGKTRSSNIDVSKSAAIILAMQTGRWNDALKLQDEIFDPSNPADWYSKGNILVNLNDTKGALTCYDEALFLDTHYVKAWYRKAWLLFSTKKLKEAATCYENVLLLERWLKEAIDDYKKDAQEGQEPDFNILLNIVSSHISNGRSEG